MEESNCKFSKMSFMYPLHGNGGTRKVILLDHVWVELLVPGTVQRGGDIQPLPIQTQLKHLWTSWDLLPLDWK